MIRPSKRRTKYARRQRYLAYLSWLRTLPCAVCGESYGIDAAHVGDRGFGVKCCDLQAIPLCHKHHRRGEPESHHTLGKRFWEIHRLERDSLIAELNRIWFLISGHTMETPNSSLYDEVFDTLKAQGQDVDAIASHVGKEALENDTLYQRFGSATTEVQAALAVGIVLGYCGRTIEFLQGQTPIEGKL